MTKPALAQFWSESKEDGRAYKHPVSGARVPSVTTITGLSDKSGLAQYAADRTAKWCNDNWSLLASKDDAGAIRGARFRWKDHADERANVGNAVHGWVETWSEDGFDYPPLGHDAQQCVDRFLDFIAEHAFAPIHSEVTVWSEKHEYAGTFDWIAMLDGKMTLGDTKTSRKLHEEHRMQLAALNNADYMLLLQPDGSYVQKDMPEIESLVFLHLRPDDYDDLYQRSDKSFYALEELSLAESDVYFRKFLGYRAVFEAEQELKVLRKSAKVQEESEVEW